VFCDGDFWHGHDWEERKRRLAKGTNSAYWVQKIERNIARDLEIQARLERSGWHVLRLWESEIIGNQAAVLAEIQGILDGLE
jgi:DNA mismatch endonuclease (patch repair protein)